MINKCSLILLQSIIRFSLLLILILTLATLISAKIERTQRIVYLKKRILLIKTKKVLKGLIKNLNSVRKSKIA